MTEAQCYIGKNAISNFADVLKQYSPNTVVLVRGDASYIQSGAEELVGSVLKQFGCKLIEYKDFSVNPKIEEAETGANCLKNNNTNLIVAVGGGSALDVAKAMRLFHSFGEEPKADDFHPQKELIPLVAIPTTAGTGSEATHFSVLYKNGQKYSIAHPMMLPDVVIVDPIFTQNIPPYLTACTGFDALAQAIEAYWNVYATDESDSYAAQAIPELVECLPLLIANLDNAQLRERVSTAAFWAGKAINITKTTAPHAFSYSFTTHYGFPHGHAVALTIPYFLQFNNAEKQEQLQPSLSINCHHQKMQQLYTWIGATDHRQAAKKMQQFIEGIGLSFQLPKDFQPTLIHQNVNAERLANNPRKMNNSEIEDVVAYLQNCQKEDFSKYNGEGTTLRKAQLRMLDMLIEVDKICRKHQIDYWLDFGTLLGAVRHKGFIPWDDDLDISVMRKDYKRLRKVLQEELPEQFVFQDWTTDKYAFDHFARVKDTKSLFDYPYFRLQKHRGLHIDIYMVEKGVSILMKKRLDFLFGRVFRTLNNYGHLTCNSAIKRYFLYFCAISLAPLTYLLVGIERLIAHFSSKDLLILSFGTNWYRERYSKDIFPLQEICFENHKFYAPHNTDKHLRHLYNNYMAFPPEEDRLSWHGVKIEVYD